MADKRMRLRAIVVSTRAALESLPSASDRIRGEADALLAELEADTRADGADLDLLRDIEEARSGVRLRPTTNGTRPDRGLTPAARELLA